MNRIFFFLPTALLLAVAFASAQGTPGMELTAAQQRFEVGRSNIVNGSVVVRNLTKGTQRYSATLTLPIQWRTLTVEQPFEILSQQSELRLLSFALPSSTAAGIYHVEYSVTDGAPTPHAASVRFEVVVPPVYTLDLRVVEAPRFVIAGKPYTVTMSISNRGNTPVDIFLTGHNSHSFACQIDTTTLRLTPLATQALAVRVQTTTTLSDKVINTTEVTARIRQHKELVQRASASVDVIPQVESVTSVFHELPVYARLRSTGDRTGTRQQIEVIGSGSLTESRRDRLEFLIRSPETQSASVLGLRDEYRVQYRSANVEVQLGDWNYSLSHLTELSRYAAGASARVRLGNLLLGGFYNQNRHPGPKQQEAAGFVRYTVTPEIQFGANVLGKHDAVQSRLGTLHGIVNPWQTSEVEAEYGLSTARGKRGQAVALNILGRERWFSYEARYVNADPQYAGYYRDVSLASMSVNVFPWESIRLEGYFRDEKRNLHKDTLHSYAPRDRYEQIGVGYSSLVSVHYRLSRQEDLFPTSKYRRQQQTAQLHLGYNFTGVSLFADADLGTTRDILTNKRYPFRRYAAFASVSPSAAQSLTLSLEHAVENNLYTDERQERYSAGLTSWALLWTATQVSFNVYGSRFLSSFNQTYGFVDLTVDHLFSFGHRIVVKGRQNYSTPLLDARNRAYSVEYSIPIGIPVHRIASLGQLRGRITDERGAGLRDVLVNAGTFVAVTDANGNYFFPSLLPATYYVVIDASSIGLDRVTLRPMPVEVTIRGGAEERLDVGVIKSARIAGTVHSFDFADESITDTTKTEIVDTGGWQGMILELSNGVELQRRVTDVRGRFVFADLRPGRWTLRVAGGEIPQLHVVERESVELQLLPGGEEQVSLKILPRRRTIRIIQQGFVVQQPPVAAQPQTPRSKQAAPSLPCLVSYDNVKKGFVLQVSSWGTEEKAKRAARSAEQATGIRGFVERADAPTIGVRYRVFLGLFKTALEAEAACGKLRSSSSE